MTTEPLPASDAHAALAETAVSAGVAVPAENRSLIDPEDVRIFSGRSNPPLAARIADHLGVPLDTTHVERFSNDNLEIQLGASVRGRTVFIVQSLIEPVAEHILELLMMLDIARGAAAKEVHAIVPYFSYARSDKKNQPRISITARLIADLIETAGATHVMTMTLHSPQVHGFFSIPVDPLTARRLFVHHLQRRHPDPSRTVVVAPDAGGAKSAARFAEGLGLPVAIATKTRVSDTHVTMDPLVGRQVVGFREAYIYDDEIATGGSIEELSHILVENGIEEIVVCSTHGLLLGNATDRLGHIPQISEIIVTDSVPIPARKHLSNLTILSVAPVFGEAIRRNFGHESLGDLFTFGDV